MMTDILKVANMYADGIKQVMDRREKWIQKATEVKEYMSKIATYLNENAAYKPGYYVDTFYAFDDKTSGTCVEMPSITFRSGDIPMSLTFRNKDGNTISYAEKGFQITFNPTPTGEVAVMLFPHHSDFYKTEQPYFTLMIIDNLDDLTPDHIDDILIKAMQDAFYTSFTGMAETNNDVGEMTTKTYTPIGFKRFETTEKAK